MGSKQGLFLEQQNKLVMTPQVYQAIEILQLPILELVNYVNNEFNENPLLEAAEDLEQSSEVQDEGIEKQKEQEIDQLVNDILHEDREYWLAAASGEGEYPQYDSPYHDKNSLQEYLMEQLRFVKHGSKLSDKLFEAAEYIIGNLDNNGYLTCSIKEMADLLKVPEKDMIRALTLVQQLDPPGIGARDLKECLLLQFALIPDHPLELAAILDYLDDLAAGHYKKIANALKITVKDVRNMEEYIKLLDPKPGSRFSGSNTLKYIVPDAVIKKVGDEYTVVVNERDVPRVCINDGYRRALLEHQDEELKKYVRQKVTSALNLIKSIELRRITIQEVLESIVQRQKDFLEKGVSALKPLTMKEIAEELKIHESTVSRVSANKYVQTPRGLYSIKCFFAGSIGQEQEITPERIKEDVKKYISMENPAKPLSDNELSDIFQKEGIVISRRTIAKYRDELGIPPTTRRRVKPV